MPENECFPLFDDADRLTVTCTEAIKGKRFVAPAGGLSSGPGMPAQPSVGASDPTEGGNIRVAIRPGEYALGVSSWDGALGEKIGCITQGVVPVNAGETIVSGDLVQAGEGGSAFKAGAAESTTPFLETGAGNAAIIWRAIKPGKVVAKVTPSILIKKPEGVKTPFKIEVAAENIVTITLETGAAAGVAITTAQELVEKANANAAVAALLEAYLAEGSDGSGIVAELEPKKEMAGGTSTGTQCGLAVQGATVGKDAYIKLHC